MASIIHLPSTIPRLPVSRFHHKHPKPWKSQTLSNISHSPIRYSNTPQFEPAPTTYKEQTLLPENSNIFETMKSPEAPITKSEPQTGATTTPFMHLTHLRKTLWILGPMLLLITGVVPTLWLPLPSIFPGPTIAGLLSLTGLDCIFNLGSTLFLLMADSTARPEKTEVFSKPPFNYRFYNVIANVAGFAIPLVMFLGSQRGMFLQPQIPFIPFMVLLGPYFLLLAVQMVTEMLTWHWRSPVWLLTPVVYEGYRLLQLMRGLRLGAEVAAPDWVMHTVRGLVCGWVVVLGVQLMRVAWYAGFTARDYQHKDGGGGGGDDDSNEFD